MLVGPTKASDVHLVGQRGGDARHQHQQNEKRDDRQEERDVRTKNLHLVDIGDPAGDDERDGERRSQLADQITMIAPKWTRSMP